jgi:hypothetical protein
MCRMGSNYPGARHDWIDPISAHHQHLIRRDHTLEVVQAGDQADVFQYFQLLLRFAATAAGYDVAACRKFRARLQLR